MPVFELYRSDGTLQLDLASQLPQTLGVIECANYPSSEVTFYEGTVYIPGWVNKREWFSYEGTFVATSFFSPIIYRTGNSVYFKVSKNSPRPRIKYGVF